MSLILLFAVAMPVALVGVMLLFNRSLPVLFRHRATLFFACGILQLLVLAAQLTQDHVGLVAWLAIPTALLYFALAIRQRTSERAT